MAAEDRGGLQYKIEVGDAFSTNTEKFVKAINDAKTAWKEFRKEFNKVGDGLKKINDASKKIAEANDTLKKGTKKVAENLERQKIAADALERAAGRRLGATRRTISAEAQVTAELQAQAIARREIADGVRAQAAEARSIRESNVTKALERQVGLQDRLNLARAEFNILSARGLGADALGPAVVGGFGTPGGQAKDVKQDAQKKIADQIELQNTRLSRQINQINTIQSRLIGVLATHRLISAQIQAQATAPIGARGGAAAAAAAVGATPAAARRAQASLAGVGAQAQSTARQVTNLGGTLRRLLLLFGALAGARLFIRGLRQATQAGFDFNSQIEQAELGLASLFLATGEVRDALGEATDASLGLVIAQQEARRQINLLREDAFRTTATFEQLVDTFQVAIGPGLSAGLDVDEIRNLTVQIAQAASAIALPQNQLAEEIRSLLSGTIQARTTRIATVLGITNEDIRNAKEAGVLVEFLESRFKSFNEAGKKAITTFSGLTARLRDTFSQLLGSAGEGAFDRVKAVLTDIIDTVSTFDVRQGIRIFDPAALATAAALFTILDALTEEFNRLRGSFSGEEFTAFAEAVAEGLRTLVVLGGVTFQTFIVATRVVLAVFNSIVAALGSIAAAIDSAFGSGSVRGLVVAFGTLAIAVGLATGITKGFGLVLLTFTGIASGVTKALGFLRIAFNIVALSGSVLIGTFQGIAAAAGGFTALFVTLSAFAAPIFIAVGAFVALIAVLEELTGFDLSFFNVLKALVAGVGFAFNAIVVSVKFILNILEKAAKLVIFLAEEAFAGTIAVVRGVAGALLTVVGIFNSTAARLGRQLLQERRALEKEVTETEQLRRKLLRQLESFEGSETEFSFTTGDIDIGSLDQLRDFEQAIESALDKTRGEEFIKSLNLDRPVKGAETFADVLEAIPGSISLSNDLLKLTADQMKEISDEAKEVKEALTLERATFGLEGLAKTITELETKSQLRVEKEKLALNRSITEDRERRLSAQIQLDRQSRQLLFRSEEIQRIVERGVETEIRITAAKRGQAQAALQVEDIERRIAGFREQRDDASALDLSGDLVQAKDDVVAFTIQLREARDVARTIFTDVEGVDAQAAAQLIIDRVEQLREENVATQRISLAQESRLVLEELITQALVTRVATAAVAEQNRILNDISNLRIEVEAQEDLNRAIFEGSSARSESIDRSRQIRLLLTELETEERATLVTVRRLEAVKRLSDLQVQSAQAAVLTARATNASEKEIQSLLEIRTTKLKENADLFKTLGDSIERAGLKARQSRADIIALLAAFTQETIETDVEERTRVTTLAQENQTLARQIALEESLAVAIQSRNQFSEESLREIEQLDAIRSRIDLEEIAHETRLRQIQEELDLAQANRVGAFDDQAQIQLDFGVASPEAEAASKALDAAFDLELTSLEKLNQERINGQRTTRLLTKELKTLFAVQSASSLVKVERITFDTEKLQRDSFLLQSQTDIQQELNEAILEGSEARAEALQDNSEILILRRRLQLEEEIQATKEDELRLDLVRIEAARSASIQEADARRAAGDIPAAEIVDQQVINNTEELAAAIDKLLALTDLGAEKFRALRVAIEAAAATRLVGLRDDLRGIQDDLDETRQSNALTRISVELQEELNDAIRSGNEVLESRIRDTSQIEILRTRISIQEDINERNQRDLLFTEEKIRAEQELNAVKAATAQGELAGAAPGSEAADQATVTLSFLAEEDVALAAQLAAQLKLISEAAIDGSLASAQLEASLANVFATSTANTAEIVRAAEFRTTQANLQAEINETVVETEELITAAIREGNQARIEGIQARGDVAVFNIELEQIQQRSLALVEENRIRRANHEENLRRIIELQGDPGNTPQQVQFFTEQEQAAIAAFNAQLAESRAEMQGLAVDTAGVEVALRAAQEAAALEQLKEENGEFLAGFLVGLKDFGKQFADTFSAVTSITFAAFNDLNKTLSSTIVDAFDRSTETSFRDALKGFFKRTATLVVQQIVGVLLSAVAGAIIGSLFPGAISALVASDQGALGIFGSFAQFFSGIGKAKGGSIKSSERGRPSLAHYAAPATSRGGRIGKALGLAEGGEVPSGPSTATATKKLVKEEEEEFRRLYRSRSYSRSMGFVTGGKIHSHFSTAVKGYAMGGGLPGLGRPKNLDRRDTVPIWAQPGEFMMRLSAVHKYGPKFMNLLNAGMIDPLKIDGLFPSSNIAHKAIQSAARGPGFQTGGLISESVGQVVDAGDGEGGGGFTPAVIVGGERELGRLIGSGERALDEYLQENRQLLASLEADRGL